ncbi:MAG: ParA family protein, partial [Bacteroidota bacterium]
IAIASTKGGVGKSTIGLNLTCELSSDHKVVLLDADPQGTAIKWSSVRTYMIEEENLDLQSIFIASMQGESLLEMAIEKSETGHIVFIDTRGADSKSTRSALLRCDYILTFSAPSPADLWEVEVIIDMAKSLGKIQKKKIPVLLAYNRVPTNRRVTSVRDAKEYLDENMIAPDYIFDALIHERIAFQHSIREGKAVSEYKDSAARVEIANLADEFIQFLGVTKDKRKAS